MAGAEQELAKQRGHSFHHSVINVTRPPKRGKKRGQNVAAAVLEFRLEVLDMLESLLAKRLRNLVIGQHLNQLILVCRNRELINIL